MNGYYTHSAILQPNEVGCAGLLLMPHQVGHPAPPQHVFCTVCSPKGRAAPTDANTPNRPRPIPLRADAFAAVEARAGGPARAPSDAVVSVRQICHAARRALYALHTGAAGAAKFLTKAALRRLHAAKLVDGDDPKTAKLTERGVDIAAAAHWGEELGGQVQIPMFDQDTGAAVYDPAPAILAEPAPAPPAVEARPTDRWFELATQQADRFWSKVDKSGVCWMWTAARDRDGYGKFQINEKGWSNGKPVQKHVRAHRAAWALTNGPLSDEDVVMHSCDNPPCCNPAHLRVGTQADNVRDCADKGRIARGERHGSRTKPEKLMRGEAHHKAKIDKSTAEKIRELAAVGVGTTEIARMLGITVNIASGVATGRTWNPEPSTNVVNTKPLIKWVGGKGRLLKDILPILPQTFGRYIEPFAGGLALFFRLQPRGAYLADANQHLVRVYRSVRDHADEVIAALQEHKNDKTYYEGVRADFNSGYGDDVWRAAALIYMNRAGFNGLCRFNGDGGYNVPFGDGEPKTICDVENIRACSALLQESTVEWADFRKAEAVAQAGDFCYIDSPYLPESEASFVKYTKDGFTAQDHEACAALFRRLAARGVHVLASNSDTPKTRELYAGFEMRELTRSNSVNSKASARGGKRELLILGGTWTPRGAT